jgi:hypothetical protein
MVDYEVALVHFNSMFHSMTGIKMGRSALLVPLTADRVICDELNFAVSTRAPYAEVAYGITY